MTGRIDELADDLARSGVDAEHLRSLQVELDLVERPGVIRRLSERALSEARRQWELALGELEDSRRVLALISVRAARLQRLSPEESDEVRSQVADLLRMVPATVIVATNYSIPIPGTSLFTPMILRKLNLLPSRWRESHLLAELGREASRLHAEGRHDAAARIEALESTLASEADAREAAEREANVLTHWDRNRNGVFDEDEREAYEQACAEVRALIATHGHRRRWYLSTRGGVVGPVRLTELTEVGPNMVCFEGRSGWVALADVVERPQTA